MNSSPTPLLPPSCLVIVGEKSGEEHFMSFFLELKNRLPELHFFGVGGDLMKENGASLLYHLKDFSSVGFVEVLSKISFYFKAEKRILDEVDKRQTKVAILVDFQEFNLRLAQKLKKKGIKVLYFVAPQAWAWRENRAKTLGKTVHTLYTILPFEKDWFMKRGVLRVIPVLHPVLQKYKTEIEEIDKIDEEELVKEELLLLPGSRNSEVSKLLPLFYKAADHLRQKFGLKIGIVKSSSVKEENYFFDDQVSFDSIYDSQYLSRALKKAKFCIASSGTVTLTCGLFAVPTIVCYQISFLSELIFASIVPYRGPISLTNIVLQEIIFPELLQNDVNVENLEKIIQYWLTEAQVYEKIKSRLKEMKNLLSGNTDLVASSMEEVIGDTYGLIKKNKKFS